jgi:hypothetical protein
MFFSFSFLSFLSNFDYFALICYMLPCLYVLLTHFIIKHIIWANVTLFSIEEENRAIFSEEEFSHKGGSKVNVMWLYHTTYIHLFISKLQLITVGCPFSDDCQQFKLSQANFRLEPNHPRDKNNTNKTYTADIFLSTLSRLEHNIRSTLDHLDE